MAQGRAPINSITHGPLMPFTTSAAPRGRIAYCAISSNRLRHAARHDRWPNKALHARRLEPAWGG
eukprot:10941908-Alexandrium_andersonii.AAC.1